ncbi:MAG: serine/threonine-protein kinase [Planctomycetota bacterium]|nr:serine/threonine-protein kinase [Planctomycetota bacterium]
MIGRARECGLRIEEPGVSRIHASIRERDGADWLGDLGSSNGTWLLGEGSSPRRIVDETSLRNGDRIRIGSRELIYRSETQAGDYGDGRWQKVTTIGSGGMGEVLHAYDSDLGCSVAVKKIRSNDEDRAELLQRLHVREASIGRSIDHPNVVRVLDDAMVDNSPVQVLEWIGGGDLAKSMRNYKGDQLKCLEVVRQIALGLAAAHDSGVVHSDLKPSNILQVAASSSADDVQILSRSEEDISAVSGSELEDRINFRKRALESLKSPPFVARSGELALIESAVQSQDRCWIPIFGERGVGRHRLAEESLRRFGDRVVVAEEFTIPAEGFTGICLTPMSREWPEEKDWVTAREAFRKDGILKEIHLGPLLPGPAGRLVESLVEARSGEGAFFLSHLDGGTGADGHPVRLLRSIERSIERGAWRPQEDGSFLYPLRLKESAREELKRLGAALDATSPVSRQLLERISLFEGALTGAEMASLLNHDRAIFHSLVEDALGVGILSRSADGSMYISSPALNQALSTRVPDRERQTLVRDAADLVESKTGLDAGDPRSMLRIGKLLKVAGRYQGALDFLLRAGLKARSSYSRNQFLEALDDARVLVREAAASGERRAVDAAEKAVLGGDPRGLVSIERLRKLPVDVRVKIADFGIARHVGEQNAPDGLAWGTPRYMSPEQARREILTAASDIFSLGLMTIEMISGVHPLGNLRGGEAIRKLAAWTDVAAVTREIPESWRQLIVQMLDPEPLKRPSASTIAGQISVIQTQL